MINGFVEQNESIKYIGVVLDDMISSRSHSRSYKLKLSLNYISLSKLIIGLKYNKSITVYFTRT